MQRCLAAGRKAHFCALGMRIKVWAWPVLLVTSACATTDPAARSQRHAQQEAPDAGPDDSGVQVRREPQVEVDRAPGESKIATGLAPDRPPATMPAGSPAAPPSSPAPAPAGSSSFCGSGLTYCEDFDSLSQGASSGKGWQASTTSGTVSVDNSRAHSGRQALRLTVAASSYAKAFMDLPGTPLFPVPGNAFYGRMFVYLDSVPAGSVHWTLVQGDGPVSGRDFTAYYRYGGQYDGKLMANYETKNVASDCWKHANTVMPVKRWACVEWFFDGPKNGLQLWLDGTEISDAAVHGRGEGCVGNWQDDWLAPQFSLLHLGWEHYQQTEGRQLWLDDVAVGSSRIGCAAR